MLKRLSWLFINTWNFARKLPLSVSHSCPHPFCQGGSLWGFNPWEIDVGFSLPQGFRKDSWTSDHLHPHPLFLSHSEKLVLEGCHKEVGSEQQDCLILHQVLCRIKLNQEAMYYTGHEHRFWCLLPGFKAQLSYLQSLGPVTSLWTSLCLCFLTCKMRLEPSSPSCL